MWVYKKVLMGTLNISMKASNSASGPCYNRSPTTTVPIGPSIDCHPQINYGYYGWFAWPQVVPYNMLLLQMAYIPAVIIYVTLYNITSNF